MTHTLDARSYTSALLAGYLELPDTPSRSRPNDRILAGQLYQRQIPLETVQHVFLLATARRHLRLPDAPPLQPIRSLYYFLPLIEELLQAPLPNGCDQYLRRKLATRNSRRPSSPASVQKTAFPGDR
jgi:hypothetical protein